MKCNVRNTEFNTKVLFKQDLLSGFWSEEIANIYSIGCCLVIRIFLTVIPYTVAHLYYHKYCHVGTYYVLWRLNLDMSMVEYKTPSNVCTMLWVNSHQRSNFGARHMSDTIYISLFRSQERLILNWMRDFDWMKTQLD